MTNERAAEIAIETAIELAAELAEAQAERDAWASCVDFAMGQLDAAGREKTMSHLSSLLKTI